MEDHKSSAFIPIKDGKKRETLHLFVIDVSVMGVQIKPTSKEKREMTRERLKTSESRKCVYCAALNLMDFSEFAINPPPKVGINFYVYVLSFYSSLSLLFVFY